MVFNGVIPRVVDHPYPVVIWIYYLAYAQGFFPNNNKYIQKCFVWVVQ